MEANNLTFPQDFLKKLVEIRKEQGLSVGEVAKLLRWTTPKVYRFESGELYQTIENLQAYCNAIGVELQINTSQILPTKFVVKEDGIVFNENFPNFSLKFIKQQDGSYTGSEIIWQNVSEKIINNVALQAAYCRAAGDFYYEYLQEHSPKQK